MMSTSSSSALHDGVGRVVHGGLQQLAVHVGVLGGQMVDGGLDDLPLNVVLTDLGVGWRCQT
jgi:hypothetical protein